MKFILNLVIAQIIAVMDVYIYKALNDWTSTHYDIYPVMIYHVLVYIIFGILLSAAVAEWKKVSAQANAAALICGIADLCAVVGLYFYGINVSAMMLILLGAYAYMGISGLRTKFLS